MALLGNTGMNGWMKRWTLKFRKPLCFWKVPILMVWNWSGFVFTCVAFQLQNHAYRYATPIIQKLLFFPHKMRFLMDSSGALFQFWFIGGIFYNFYPKIELWVASGIFVEYRGCYKFGKFLSKVCNFCYVVVEALCKWFLRLVIERYILSMWLVETMGRSYQEEG